MIARILPHLRAVLSCWVLISFVQAAVAEGDATPQQTIMGITEQFVSALIEESTALKKDPQRGVTLARELLVPHLDFARFSRWVLGKHWRGATDEQRSRFVDAFTESLLVTYATAMTSFVDEIISVAESITYPPARFRHGDREAMVPMRLRLTTGGEAEIRYRMHLEADRWVIYDVTVEGISLATTYRLSYNNLIKERGLDGLLADLESSNRARRLDCQPVTSECGSSGPDKSSRRL